MLVSSSLWEEITRFGDVLLLGKVLKQKCATKLRYIIKIWP